MKIMALFVAAFLSAALGGTEAQALPAKPAQIAKQKSVVKVNARVRRHRNRSGRALFRNWCAYNCYAVPPCFNRCYGRYGYSRFAYDEDIPFRYSYDRDASPIDNGDAFVYRVTGEPFIRAFERIY